MDERQRQIFAVTAITERNLLCNIFSGERNFSDGNGRTATCVGHTVAPQNG